MSNNTPWKSDKFYTSLWNWEEDVRKSVNLKDKIKLHDVTLRDGEQQAGIVLSADQKIDLALRMDEMGIHRIEAGMPAVSKEDERAIKEIVKRTQKAEIFAFARCMVDDVKRAADCGVKGVIVEIPSNEEMIRGAYGWEMQKAIDLSVKASSVARELGLYTVFFPIDMSRASIGWVLDLVTSVARDGHMDALTIVDTMGGLSPHAVPFLVKTIKSKIQKPLELHFHDDFGLAAANSLMGLAAGADVCHTTISSIGERAGNCGYEDIALALLTMYGYDLGIDYSQIYRLSQVMREYTGLKIRGNRGGVGEDIFNIESGIVSDWYAHCKDTDKLLLAPYLPSLTGHHDMEIILGKHSGKANIECWLERYGRDLDKAQIVALTDEVKFLALKKHGRLDEADFLELLKKVD